MSRLCLAHLEDQPEADSQSEQLKLALRGTFEEEIFLSFSRVDKNAVFEILEDAVTLSDSLNELAKRLEERRAGMAERSTKLLEQSLQLLNPTIRLAGGGEHFVVSAFR